jgi:hypothetical protein
MAHTGLNRLMPRLVFCYCPASHPNNFFSEAEWPPRAPARRCTCQDNESEDSNV